jgi:GH25 family lysozyme M1 (1,4-beta-N-acetylmuramidase)
MGNRIHNHKFVLRCSGALLTLIAAGIISINDTNDAHAAVNTAPTVQINNNTAIANTNTNSSQSANTQAAVNSNVPVSPTVNAATKAHVATTAQTPPAPNQPINQTGWDINKTTADAVDISWLQPNMNEGNFVQLRNQGVNYVIIQLTKGTYMHDPYAAEQVRDAYAAGLGVSAYHFTKFTDHNSAVAEANYFADRADQLGLPASALMFADVEDPLNEYNGVTNDLRAFFDQLSARGYWNHGVYTGLWFDSVYNVSSVVGRNRTWIARYPYDHQITPQSKQDIANMGYGAWQYCGFHGYTLQGYGELDADTDLGLFGSAIGLGFHDASNLDNFQIDPRNNKLNVSGWFASYDSRGRDQYHYIILLDQNNHEIARQRVNTTARPDVANVYRYLYGAGNSGFSASFNINNPALHTALLNGSKITVIFRNSAAADGNSNYSDHWFNQQTAVQNQAYLDNYDVDNGNLHVSGWHAADQSVFLPYQWIVLYDQTTHRELGRIKVASQARADVAKAYPHICNAGQSGFSANFKIADNQSLAAALLHGDNIQVVARYSNDSNNGEGVKTDYWLNGKAFGNGSAAYLDNFKINGNKLVASGWFANDRSRGASHRYIILYDQSLGHELSRQEVNATDRADVAKVYPNLYNAAQSGFSASFNIDQNSQLARALQNGDHLQVIARDSDTANGEGEYVQNWFSPQSFNANNAHLDSFQFNQRQSTIQVTGWHATDQAAGRPYHFDILLDTDNHNAELARIKQDTVERDDVATVFPDVYNAAHSGFSVNFKLTDQIKAALKAGHHLQIIDRYTTDPYGNRDSVDFWFSPKTL